MSCLVRYDLGRFDPDHFQPNMTWMQRLSADDQSSPACKELKYKRLTMDFCACNHKKSVTSHINCIVARCLSISQHVPLTSVLKALPGKLDIKRHSPSILYFEAIAILLVNLRREHMSPAYQIRPCGQF